VIKKKKDDDKLLVQKQLLFLKSLCGHISKEGWPPIYP
jgi:hypothetical protein